MNSQYQLERLPRTAIQPEAELAAGKSDISSSLDYYKATMSQLQHELHPEAEVTFSFYNRGQNRLMDYLDPKQLQERLDYIAQKGWSPEECDFLAGLRSSRGDQLFSGEFLDYLSANQLPPVEVTYDPATDDLAINTTGQWPLVTFWETIVMSEVNEMYFENYVARHGLDILAVYDEGDRRLSQKITTLRTHPDLKFADFGTRRHFSLRWQKHVLERLITECPENIMGTSNIGLARDLGLKPIGTFAHEMPMVYAGLADAAGLDIRGAQGEFLQDWLSRYGEDLSIALTDTFTSDFFFSDFSPEQAKVWRGLRQDSGDPAAFAERAIKLYEDFGIDPKTKMIVFSDGLDIDKIVDLHRRFKDRVEVVFGWGTTLTNDLGLPALNIVMKATRVNETPTVKLSDSEGKYTGSPERIKRYEQIFASR